MATVEAPSTIQGAIPVRRPQGPFRNEPLTNFTHAENVRAMREALAKTRAELGREYDLVIGNQLVRTSDKIRSINPAHPSEVVGIHQKAGREHVEPAMQSALRAFDLWRLTSFEERSSLILRVANLIRASKFELAAWLVFEVGKNWEEADADIAETIDFCEFYAREALRLAEVPAPVQMPGERDYLRYIPLGVGAVIPPWNFPSAIMAGMTVASIVCGNTVILKPSSDSPTIAAKFFNILLEAGMPDGVVNFCPGSGTAFGHQIVEHPKIRFIAFTGSKEVGLDIHARAAQTRAGQLWIKRTVLEMGGKDAIVVCDDADLTAAIEGVALSAFGFSGQKCSACSRVVVDEKVYDVFVEHLKARVEAIVIGDPAENAAMGPVVNEAARNRILHHIDVGRTQARLVCGGNAQENLDDGYFISPTVFADVAPDSPLAQEEIFGPVLVVIKAHNFVDALAIANGTEFGLTGAIYSLSRDKLEVAERDFHVGNLYLNRKCTGAVVGAHPFGGFNMSGTDSKAGGPDYLHLFTQAKAIGEKIID